MASRWCWPERGIFDIESLHSPSGRSGKPGTHNHSAEPALLAMPMDLGLLTSFGPGRRSIRYTDAVIHCSSFCFGAAPIWLDASCPFLNSIRVGIDMMPYFAAVPGFSSTLSLTILTLPLSELEISSSAGAIMRQGPHHSAQKSTTTGSLALSTSASKVASVVFATMKHLIFWESAARGKRTYGRACRASRQLHRSVRTPLPQCARLRLSFCKART